jgi:hypothetical protein
MASLCGIGAAVSFAGCGGATQVVTSRTITANARTTANLNARLSGSCAMSASWHQSRCRYSSFTGEDRERCVNYFTLAEMGAAPGSSVHRKNLRVDRRYWNVSCFTLGRSRCLLSSIRPSWAFPPYLAPLAARRRGLLSSRPRSRLLLNWPWVTWRAPRAAQQPLPHRVPTQEGGRQRPASLQNNSGRPQGLAGPSAAS